MSYIFIPFVKMEIANQTALRGPAHIMNNTEDYDFRKTQSKTQCPWDLISFFDFYHGKMHPFFFSVLGIEPRACTC
jgi:hypothetical protein